MNVKVDIGEALRRRRPRSSNSSSTVGGRAGGRDILQTLSVFFSDEVPLPNEGTLKTIKGRRADFDLW